jgi:hypothetical protein
MATSSGGAQTITYPSTPWTYSGPTAAALPTFSFDYTGFSGMSPVWQIADIQWGQGNISVNSIEVLATENFQNGATTLTFPDLSGLTGFLATPHSGMNILWQARIQEGSAFSTTPPNGTVQSVSNGGTYTVP